MDIEDATDLVDGLDVVATGLGEDFDVVAIDLGEDFDVVATHLEVDCVVATDCVGVVANSTSLGIL